MEQATRRFAEPGSTIQNLLVNLIPNEKRQKRRDHLAWSQHKVLRYTRLQINNTCEDSFDADILLLPDASKIPNYSTKTLYGISWINRNEGLFRRMKLL